jgi:cytochrome-b5 reductase
MLQLVTDVFRDPEDKTCLALIFANQSEDDILVREELEAVQQQHPDRFKLWYTVDRPNEGMHDTSFRIVCCYIVTIEISCCRMEI